MFATINILTYKSRKTYLNFRNNLLLLRKNLPRDMQVRVLFIRKILDGVAAIQYLFKGKPAFFMAVIKAHRDFKRLWKMEYRDFSQVTHPDPAKIAGWYNRSIVFNYFIRGRKRFGDLTRHK